MSSMNEAAIRSRVHTIRAALSPTNSFERFKGSFMNSRASDAVKARFARLTNMPYNDVNTVVDEATGGLPNPSPPPVKGQPHERLVRAGSG